MDELARQHDIRYEECMNNYAMHKDRDRFYQDIQSADKVFVNRIKALEPSSWWEKVGKFLGEKVINIKRHAEKMFGFLVYP